MSVLHKELPLRLGGVSVCLFTGPRPATLVTCDKDVSMTGFLIPATCRIRFAELDGSASKVGLAGGSDCHVRATSSESRDVSASKVVTRSIASRG